MKKFNSNLIDQEFVYRQTHNADMNCPHFVRVERRVLVCLCGSTRFWQEFQEANYRETMAGKIVLTVGFYPNAGEFGHGQVTGCTPEQKIALDLLHCDKIDLADEVLILNVGGYVGSSMRAEVLHAERRGKNVRWLEPFKVPPDLAHIGDSLSDGPKVDRDRDNDPDYVGN